MVTSVSAPAPPRPYAWLLPFVVPLLLLVVWIAWPELDRRVPLTENAFQNPVHFWIITLAGVLSLAQGLQMSAAAQRRSDARVFLVALSILSLGGFVLLHALATPNILVTGRNGGFVSAAPIGLLVAGIFAAASSFELSPERAASIMSRRNLLRGGVVLMLVVFTLLALLKLPPFTLVPSEDTFKKPLLFCLVGIGDQPGFLYPATLLILLATALFAWASFRYLQLYGQRSSLVLLGLGTAFGVLALAAFNVGLAVTWKLSWWQWHLLVPAAFGLLGYSANRQFRREGKASQIYDSVYLDETIKQIRQEYNSALEDLVAAISRRAQGTEVASGPLAAAVAQRFDLSDGQVRVLEQAAEALASEREQIARLGALVAVGQETSVILDEMQLLQRAIALTSGAFGRDELQIGLVNKGQLDFPPELRGGPTVAPADDETRRAMLAETLRDARVAEGEGTLVLPLTVKGRAAGVLEVRRKAGSFAERDRYLLHSLAAQLSVALENARLYRQIDLLFRQYMPASVATALLADPNQAALGGAVAEISVMFGDIRGFTSLSERMQPPELVALLNRYYGAATHEVLDQGGTIDKFMGDAMMALFNAPARQPDHALRACRAALAMQRAIAPIVAESPDMPNFGIGVHTGEALVGNIGSEQIRNFTAIGDTVNLASRLQSRAQGGQVLISASTYAQVKAHAEVQPLGFIQVKGREEPVEAFVLLRVNDSTANNA